MKAFDEDEGVNGTILYSWDTPKSSNYFHLDPTSGEISLRKSLMEIAKIQEFFSFYIQATDGGGLSSVTGVTIHLASREDPIPIFSNKIYHQELTESLQVGSEVSLCCPSLKLDLIQFLIDRWHVFTLQQLIEKFIMKSRLLLITTNPQPSFHL